ncbi:MAG: hypothetical protein JSV33_05835 [bacterium]|nr:MAG: hypothetical protein JSV33_05835 [bacterium]
MKNKYLIAASLLVLLVAQPFNVVSAQETKKSRFMIELELGSVWQSRNNVQIPNNQNGTRFSLVELVGNGPYPAARVYFSWNISERHGLRFLLAPLSFNEKGRFTQPVAFSGGSFDPDVQTNATYKFNSWRLTYRYLLFDRHRWYGWIGFTAKIRDAKIQLEQQSVSAKEEDLGFVPLLHLSFVYQLKQRLQLLFDLDALAGGPGRAEDLALKLGYKLNKRLNISVGYRTLEGGADVDRVYNFAWLHFATVSVSYEF